MEPGSPESRAADAAPAAGDPEARPSADREDAERVVAEFSALFQELHERTWAANTWLGVPLLKYPTDLLVLQELIVETRPELIVETGVHSGGSALFYANLLDALGGSGRVLGVDVDLDPVAAEVRGHPRVELIEGSSTDPLVVARVRNAAAGRRTMVILDSDHTSAHVLAELRALGGLVSPGCWLVVEDTAVAGRPVWPELATGPGEALDAWLAEGQPFEVDRGRERQLLTANPRGYLRRLDGSEGEDAAAAERGEVLPAGAGLPSRGSLPGGLPALRDDADDELASLRHTVWKLAEQERRLILELERLAGELERRPAEVAARLQAQIARQAELLAEKDRALARERLELQEHRGWWARRVRDKLMRLPGLRRREAKRIRALNDRNQRLRGQAGQRR